MNSSTGKHGWARRAGDVIAVPHKVPKDMIRLGGGLAFPGEPPNIVEEAAAAAAMRTEGLQYGPLYGLNDLRDAVVGYLARDGVRAERDNILIVNGAKHGLDLACCVFIEPGMKVEELEKALALRPSRLERTRSARR
ncbi:aminotransferase class I/II-fold pyridoxal phosphate-dependent enzyme [Paraburkholderia sp.]|uniref:aminotransferase class I/II-fold pyridoxal phosphate-dependent enzyme n=1 Tax=Paraburkholderia sp. TaxID=1926495 RepID=UPI0039E3144A